MKKFHKNSNVPFKRGNYMFEIVTSSAEDTRKVGYKLGSILKGGDIVCLSGDLGTGKTVFTGGIAQALGIQGYVTSPTFCIVNEYQGKIPLYHFDVYRMESSDEMFEIGFSDYLESNGIIIIEWPERISDIIPKEHIWVSREKVGADEPDKRIIKLDFRGNKYIGGKEEFESISS